MSNKMYLDKNKFMYQMIQIYRYMKTFEIFSKQPTKIYSIWSANWEINLAKTPVRNQIKLLYEKGRN